MANKKNKLSVTKGVQSAKDFRIGIVLTEWNEDIISALFTACKETLLDFDVKKEDIFVSKVPGAFELPLGAKLISSKYKLDAIICLGCIIKGETKHDEYIANAVSSGLMSLSLALNIPVIFGVLTPKNKKQAKDRAGGKYGNKGIEAATTAIRMIHLKNEMMDSEKRIGF